MPIRTFGLNSREFYESYCRRAFSELPRDPTFPKEPDHIQVSAKTEDEAQDAVKAWRAHVDAGRIGTL